MNLFDEKHILTGYQSDQKVDKIIKNTGKLGFEMTITSCRQTLYLRIIENKTELVAVIWNYTVGEIKFYKLKNRELLISTGDTFLKEQMIKVLNNHISHYATSFELPVTDQNGDYKFDIMEIKYNHKHKEIEGRLKYKIKSTGEKGLASVNYYIKRDALFVYGDNENLKEIVKNEFCRRLMYHPLRLKFLLRNPKN